MPRLQHHQLRIWYPKVGKQALHVNVVAEAEAEAGGGGGGKRGEIRAGQRDLQGSDRTGHAEEVPIWNK